MKKSILVAAACLLAAAVLFYWGFSGSTDKVEQASNRYVLLIDSDTGTFYMQLRKGMQGAVRAQKASLSIQTVHADTDAQQLALEYKNGMSCVLLWLKQPEPMLAALAAEGVPAVVIGQKVNGYSCAIADDAATGMALLTRARELANGGRVLVLSDDKSVSSPLLCEGMRLGTETGDVDLRGSDTSIPAMEKGYAAIIATSEGVTSRLSALKAAGALGKDCAVLGIDTGDKRVSDLEKGYVTTMAFQSPYALGYIAVAQATGSAMANSAMVYRCQSTLVEAGTMYDAENVKAVFPLLQ